MILLPPDIVELVCIGVCAYTSLRLIHHIWGCEWCDLEQRRKQFEMECLIEQKCRNFIKEYSRNT